MPIQTVRQRKAHYREWGSGEKVLLLLHGWPADSSDYAELGPLLAKSGYRVIVPDLPGWGNTPPPEKPWTVSDYRDWVHDFSQQLNLNKFTLFGHSFGGRVAIKYAVKHAYQISELILCASAGIKPDPHTLRRKTLGSLASLGGKLFRLPVLNNLAPYARKILYRAAGTNDYLNADGIMKDTIVRVLEEDLTPLLPQIHLRTLLVWGSEDGATPLSDAKKMHDLINGSKLVVHEGERHNLPKNAPELVVKSLIEFLGNDTIIE
jgi:pimeloyl-ACP methyl ester carboxylesterase